jgi:hypothetical protein
MLHRLALGPGFVREACFDLQEAALAKKSLPDIKAPVFIAGLARSGSTMLLNTLYSTGAFRSLTYRDMPFVMMPGIWESMSRSSQTESIAKERAHGDRLSVDYDSPEAFEEVFWRTVCGDDYIGVNRVSAHAPGPAARKKYANFVRAVLASGNAAPGSRYLAKNNNNLLRLGALQKTFPDAQILVPFRDPVQHAMSLLRQHELFCDSHDKDRFGMHYMHWLGHWEFGLGHKHYSYTGADNPYGPSDINYWLDSWLDAYNHALATAPANSLFVSYEQLCADPVGRLGNIMEQLQVQCNVAEIAGTYAAAENRSCDGVDAALLQRCWALHEQLLER